MGSFKVRLAGYFALIALVPFVAAFQGFHSLAEKSETRRADAVLESGLRSAIVAYGEELRATRRTAAGLARRRSLQRALAKGSRQQVVRIVARVPNVVVEGPGGLRVGRVPANGVSQVVSIVGPRRPLGKVTAVLPLDEGTANRIRRRAGLGSDQRVAFLPQSTVGPGKATMLEVDGVEFRAIASDGLRDPQARALVVLASQSAIDHAAASIGKRLVLTMFGILVFLVLIAYFEGRSIVRTLGRLVAAANDLAHGRLDRRVDVRGPDEFARLSRAFNEMADQLEARISELDDERRRLRDVTVRFGEALAATHDIDELLRVVVETAVEATGARGGALLRNNHELFRKGDPDAGVRRLEFHLSAGDESFGRLVLTADGFSKEQTETAEWFVNQARTALANARHHSTVQRQALVDTLTGLANRRLCEAALEKEIGRADRFGEPFSLIVGDIDDFKRVNDRYGHQTGDEVLKEFARTLQETVRDIDLAGRWGGEEFVVGLPGTDLAGGAHLAERVRAAFAERTIEARSGERFHVTATFGVAEFDGRGGLLDLLGTADAALYRAKHAGKDRVATATSSTPEPSVRAASLGG
ncbi:MAG TPA: diguanylate cyclase [Gaiellaceae bacterium]|nr:diguanylate cyclase [Gaiellaceae bacterium]